MKNFLLVIISISLLGCATTTLTEYVSLENFEDEFVNVATQNITYDPYADEIYVNEKNITTAYRNLLQSYISDLENKNGVDLSNPRNFRPYIGGYAESGGRHRNFINGVWYEDLTEYYPDINDLNPNISIARSVNSQKELEFLVRYGWFVRKSGPTKSVEGFQYYEIPMEIYYHICSLYSPPFENIKTAYDSGIYPGHKQYVVPFLFRQKAAVTLEADAVKDDEGNTVELKTEETKDTTDAFEDLKKLDELYKAGILTEDEYNSKKKDILERI